MRVVSKLSSNFWQEHKSMYFLSITFCLLKSKNGHWISISLGNSALLTKTQNIKTWNLLFDPLPYYINSMMLKEMCIFVKQQQQNNIITTKQLWLHLWGSLVKVFPVCCIWKKHFSCSNIFVILIVLYDITPTIQQLNFIRMEKKVINK